MKNELAAAQLFFNYYIRAVRRIAVVIDGVLRRSNDL